MIFSHHTSHYPRIVLHTQVNNIYIKKQSHTNCDLPQIIIIAFLCCCFFILFSCIVSKLVWVWCGWCNYIECGRSKTAMYRIFGECVFFLILFLSPSLSLSQSQLFHSRLRPYNLLCIWCSMVVLWWNECDTNETI